MQCLLYCVPPYIHFTYIHTYTHTYIIILVGQLPGRLALPICEVAEALWDRSVAATPMACPALSFVLRL